MSKSNLIYCPKCELKGKKMKKHITVEQLNELSDKGKRRLRKWWKPTFGDKIYYEKKSIEYWFDNDDKYNMDNWKNLGWGIAHKEPKPKQYKDHRLPLLSIGQMIEFLRDSSYEGSSYFGANETDVQHQGKELCDALWEAVKEVLEK